MAAAGLLPVLAEEAQKVGGSGTPAQGASRSPVRTAAAAAAAPGRRLPATGRSQHFKAAGFVRKWMVVDQKGQASVFQPHKLEITHQMGVQLRDLRLLDPLLATSYPSAILCRPAALVINLENVKMVVTTDRAFITNLEDENTVAFVEELCRRLASQAAALAAAEAAAEAGGGAPPALVAVPGTELPFELRVVEVALDTVCTRLEALTGELEAAAHPALDSLTVKVNKDNLERVRRIKSRMVRLTTRVEMLREVLERLLDDEGDMFSMHLSAKQEIDVRRMSTAGEGEAATPFDVAWRSEAVRRSASQAAGGGGVGAEGGGGAAAVPAAMDWTVSGAQTPGTPLSLALTYDSEDEEQQATDVVEDLLEAYFMFIDNTWNKLQTLCEYIDDTEDFINIELDSKRNHLIRVDLILTALNASVSLIIAITALFAMNFQMVPNAEDWPGQGPYWWFVTIVVSCSAGAIALFSAVVGFAKYKRLL